MYATIICIILFGSPLSTIASVVKERDASSILAPFTAAQVANCLLWTVYGLFAARDILPYEELTYDYGYVVGSVEGKTLRCLCGAPSCRGYLF